MAATRARAAAGSKHCASIGMYAFCRCCFWGFSAGLPFYLVFSTLSAWLRQAGVQRSTIGMLSWVGILYSIKFLWAPVVDRVAPPFFHRILGRRRGWMLLAQLGLAAGLFKLSLGDPAAGVRNVALGAPVCRILRGYPGHRPRRMAHRVRRRRDAGSAAGGLPDRLQDSAHYRQRRRTHHSRVLRMHVSYATMAALVGVGIVTTLLVSEPQPRVATESVAREERVVMWLESRAHWPRPLLDAGEWLMGAVVCPLLDFFARYGPALAILTLVFVGSYRLTDFTMGSMVNPFYIDHGYTLTNIAQIVKVYGC